MQEGLLANGAVGDTSLDTLFCDDDNDSFEDASDSDGFLSEDSNCPQTANNASDNDSEDEFEGGTLSGHNREIHLELAKQKRKLDKLKEKDPDFAKYLENHSADLEQFRSEETYSDEEVEPNEQGRPTGSDNLNLHDAKVLTSSAINAWCQLGMDQQSISVLPNLLNAFRAACHYGADDPDVISSWRIQKQEVFCKILMFVLREADGIFRRLLGISSTGCKKETILELRNTTKWKTVKPLLKSYLRNALYLLNQVTDHQILDFTLSRLRTSIIFFIAFPSLRQRLIKVSVHLWATGGGSLSLSSFFIIRDMVVQLNSDCIDTCMKKTYKAFIAHCKFVEPANLKHIRFLGDSVVELYSLDMQKSYGIALASIQLLAKILQQALRMKNKEALKEIYNWQYTNCIDLWVKYISANIRDHDLQPLLYLVIQLINGVAHLFPGPRYLPLRLKCIQMLNQLSNSSRVFIPIASVALSSLEYRESSKADARPRKTFNISSLLKVPKQLLKSRDFQEECVLSVIELLSVHFAQWSYHISFPELATIPLIHLRKFHEKTTVESLRRLVKRLIDQVEQNVEFVQKKRDEVAFSPKDEASVDSFLQLEKSGRIAPFTQYYASVLQNSISRNAVLNEKISMLEQKESRRRRRPVCASSKDGERILENGMANSMVEKSRRNIKRRKQRT
ncbi:protein REBELOTE isoform X2 [Magnolia sinica]|uniref:protein REBELOTE isoform X2 n=1 Tax=Magnolia sinica TaxID=86752 RepID=UPI00265B650F|nr:protein REBELOTE isoform X2 [Magnolia sinica]